MEVFDDQGELIEATCSFEKFHEDHSIIIESSGGADKKSGRQRRNPEYNKLFETILRRLKKMDIQIKNVFLESRLVIKKPESERLVETEIEYPFDLKTLDLQRVQKALQSKLGKMHQSPTAKKPGNNQKKIRIVTNKTIDYKLLQNNPHDFVEKFGNELDEKGHNSLKSLNTQKKQLQNIRIGQDKFREALLKKFRQQCPITGITHKNLLIASHIKPWRHCSDSERTEPDNGILLSKLIDGLFDNGLVSFKDNGAPIVSDTLSVSDKKIINIDSWPKIKFSSGALKFLDYHRTFIFL